MPEHNLPQLVSLMVRRNKGSEQAVMESREGCARAGCYMCSEDCLSCNLLPWLPAHSHSQHRQRTALSRRQGAAIVISDRQEEVRIGKYPSKNAERDTPHLPPCSEVSSCLSDHRAGHPQRAEAPVQVTVTSLATHTL